MFEVFWSCYTKKIYRLLHKNRAKTSQKPKKFCEVKPKVLYHRYFPKGDFPSDHFQVATSQMSSGNFPKVRLGCSVDWVLRLGWARGSSATAGTGWGTSAATRTDLGSCRLGKYRTSNQSPRRSDNSKSIWAEHFRMVDIEINAWSSLFLNIETNLILYLYTEKFIKFNQSESHIWSR